MGIVSPILLLLLLRHQRIEGWTPKNNKATTVSPYLWFRNENNRIATKILGSSCEVSDTLETTAVVAAASTEDHTYNTNLILAKLANARHPRKVRQAMRLWESLEVKDTVAYNSILKALAKVSPSQIQGRPAHQKARELLEEMKEVHETQTRANALWYEQLKTTNSTSVATDDSSPPRVSIKPNVRSYSTVMDAFARVGNIASARVCHEILEELIDMYVETQDGALKPTIVTYNTLLTAYSKARDANACLELLETMPVTPDIISYNAILHALRQQPRQAQEFLYQIPYPNARSYTTVMNAWALQGKVNETIALFQKLVEKYEDKRSEEWKPNAVTFGTVLKALKKDLPRALQVWKQMILLKVEPTTILYNHLLDACAHHPTPLVKLLTKIYGQIDRPDEYTYGTLLKACGNWRLEELALEYLEDARQSGHVSRGVEWQFRQAVPMEIWQREIPQHTPIPSRWRQNVRGR